MGHVYKKMVLHCQRPLKKDYGTMVENSWNMGEPTLSPICRIDTGKEGSGLGAEPQAGTEDPHLNLAC